MAAALTLPRVLERVGDRLVMLAGAALLATGMLLGSLATDLTVLLPLWLLLGLGYSLTLTPSGRLLRRSAHPEDRPALFAAQFALSHACWLLTYPLAGRLGAAAGLAPTFLVMAAVALIGILLAMRLWPKDHADAPEYGHTDLHPAHAHLVDHPVNREGRHAHAFVIDDLHLTWPRGA